MRVVFAEDAVADPESWGHLDHILRAVEAGWHEWQIDDPEPLEQSDWLQGTNRPFLPKLFEEAAVRSAYRSSGLLHRRSWVVSTGAGEGTLAPKAAAYLFNRPLSVMVENRFTDGLFLETVLTFLSPKELRCFLDRCEGEPLKCDSGGGVGELAKLIDAHVEEMAAQGLPPRAVVSVDSDSHYPHDVSPQAQKVSDSCESHGID
jgi:hypothetical protein